MTFQAYQAAREAHNEAQAAYNVAVAAFRAGGSYEAFGVALTALKIADAAFDAAFNAERDRTEPTEQGNQYVVPGCGHDISHGPKQIDLFRS